MIEESISVVFPVYNEQGSIEKVVNSALKFLPDTFSNFELIIVDDGSNDRSLQIINRLCHESAKLKVIHHERNMGYAATLKSGFNAAKYPLIFFMDCDGQFDISDIKNLLEFIEEFDIIAGIRKKRMDSVYRVLLGNLYNRLNSLLFNIKSSDVNCGFKLLRRSVLENTALHSKSGFINVEIMVRAKEKGHLIKEVVVRHYPRCNGKQNGASVKVFFLKILDITRFFCKR